MNDPRHYPTIELYGLCAPYRRASPVHAARVARQ